MPDTLMIILAVALIAGLGILFWKIPQARKYWKYFLILAPALFVIVLVVFLKWKRKNDKDNKAADALKDSISDIKDKLIEVNLETAIEVSAAKAKNEEKIEELKEIKKIPDRSERLKRLAGMLN